VGSPTSVDRLAPGDHACLTFSDEDERLDIVAAFVRDGLSAGLRVICYTDSHAPAALSGRLSDRGVEAQPYAAKGQLAVQPVRMWLADGGFRPARVLDELTGEIDRAHRDGFAGLRITADMGWAAQPVAGVEHLVAFEEDASQLFASAQVTAICQYDRQQFDAVTLASTTAAHSCAVAATVYHEDPVLRICRQHSPAGIRLAGEIDYTSLAVFRDALAEAVRLDRHPHINLAKLRFIDAATAGELIRTATTLAAGRSMTVLCRGLVRTVLHHVGAGDVEALHLRTAPGDF
jgi:anti-anti-sigma regulatory factor